MKGKLLSIILVISYLLPGQVNARNQTGSDFPAQVFSDIYSREDTTTTSPDSITITADNAIPVRTVGNDIIRFADATLYTLSSPVRWRGKDWLKLGGVAAGVGLVSLADIKNQQFWIGESSSIWDGMERVGWYYGKPQMAIILSSGFYLTGLAAKNEWIRETGLILGSSFITTAALQTIFKPLIGRARPRTGVGNYAFDPLKNDAAYHSFPSGHMSVASSISFVLAKRINHPIAKIGFYSLAGTTLISRMYSDSHWLSDMVMGGVITWFSTEAVIKRIEGRNKLKEANKKVSWELNPYPGGLSLIGYIK